MDPTADVKLDFKNKDAQNNWVKHWVREFVDATEDPKDDIELVLDVNNDEKLEGELWERVSTAARPLMILLSLSS